MTSLKHKLRQIEKILQVYPNASVRVKFDGDDNFRKYSSCGVTNDTFSDTTEAGVVFENLPTQKTTPLRHLSDSCRFQNGLISMLYRVLATLRRHFRQ